MGALTKRRVRLPFVNEIPKKSLPGGWFREGMAEKTSCWTWFDWLGLGFMVLEYILEGGGWNVRLTPVPVSIVPVQTNPWMGRC